MQQQRPSTASQKIKYIQLKEKEIRAIKYCWCCFSGRKGGKSQEGLGESSGCFSGKKKKGISDRNTGMEALTVSGKLHILKFCVVRAWSGRSDGA